VAVEVSYLMCDGDRVVSLRIGSLVDSKCAAGSRGSIIYSQQGAQAVMPDDVVSTRPQDGGAKTKARRVLNASRAYYSGYAGAGHYRWPWNRGVTAVQGPLCQWRSGRAFGLVELARLAGTFECRGWLQVGMR
jgi:hypothetical protein